MRLHACLAALLGIFDVLPAPADDYTVELLAEPPPPEVAEAVRKELSPDGARLLDPDGKPFLDFWMRKSIATADAPDEVGVKYGALGLGTLVGAVRAHGGGSDFRDKRIKAGVYTLRYAVQPQDGDHQGVSETRDFLLLAPAASDPSPDAMAYEPLVKLSARVAGKKHPAVFYLAERSQEEKIAGLVRDEANDRLLFECEVPAGEKGEPLRLRICVVGKAAE